jgi:hypothetical protein
MKYDSIYDLGEEKPLAIFILVLLDFLIILFLIKIIL